VPYPKGVSLGGTYSAVISAACHIRHQDGDEDGTEEHSDIASQALKRGVTVQGGRGKVIYYCFSSGNVGEPTRGDLYAAYA
jgi:hypothetical protein